MMKKSFTLTEILMTIAIIALLASLGVGVFSMVKQRSAYADTENAVTKISNAVKATQVKRGMPEYRGMIAVDNSGNVSICGSRKNSNIFVESCGGLDALLDMTVEIDGQKVIADSWNRPLVYIRPGKVNRDSFDLVSAGNDGEIDGTAVLAEDGSFNSDVLDKQADAKENDDVVNY